MLLDAFADLRNHHPGALLVLAPRHPEVAERMRSLRDYLAQRALPAAFRSEMADVAIPEGTACLVLDTMGELRDFYAAATVAHVGVDHNVLEPLAFGKPVTVVPGWNATYPSYPVYRLLSDAGTLIETRSAPELSSSWMDLLKNQRHYRERIESIETTLLEARGAVQRHLDHLIPWIPRPQ
jgi:3-deoxy-D-manno-octulosonic-acid transferase